MPTDHHFWRERRAEAESNRSPSDYLALPLGQAGSHSFATPDTVIIFGSQNSDNCRRRDSRFINRQICSCFVRHVFEDVPLAEFMNLVFTRMPGESYLLL